MPMILPLNYPDTSGADYSRTSVELSLVATAGAGRAVSQIAPALRVEGWTSWTYSRTLTPGKGYGHRAVPQVRTRGKLELETALGVYMTQYNVIEDYLAAVGATRMRGPWEQSFQLTATLYEFGLGTIRWDAIGCRIKKDGSGPEKENDDDMEVKMDLDVMNIFREGRSVVWENTPIGQAGVILTF
jgi:hypothetical protein